MNDIDMTTRKMIANEVADLVDLHAWTLSAAKAELKKRAGCTVKARSKDDFVNALRRFAKSK